MKYYLLRSDNTVSDHGDYPEMPPARNDGVWQPGSPPENSLPTLPITEKLRLLFENELPPETQADLAVLKAAVKMELEQDRDAIARLIIERANIPAELETIRQQLLELLPQANQLNE